MVSSTSQQPKKPPGLQCYATLGVSPYADTKALTSAYHRLALLHHPDKNNNSLESNAKFQQVREIFEYLSNHACREDYDRLVAGAHAGSRRELDESYKILHEIRQKIGQSEMHLNPGPNATWHNETTAFYMHKESEALDLIKLKSQQLLALDREVRQIPAEPEKTQPMNYSVAGASFHDMHAQYHEQKIKFLKQQVAIQQQQLESLRQHVTSQKQQLDIKEADIEKLRTQEQDAREVAFEFCRERDDQINLVREKTMEVDSLKEQISIRDVEEKERSSVLREEKDQLRVLNRRLLRDINALELERDQQQTEINRLKEKEARLEVERDTMRNIQKVREDLQQPQRQTPRKRSHRFRSPEEPDESTRLKQGDRGSTTKRPRADDSFTPSFYIPSSIVPSEGQGSVDNGSSATEPAAIVRKGTSPGPR
ncbi:hypothetical protein QBC32DRAFT_347691 [Pseudoneurospora amorphoporcata]|uniref:J domain-containing protein n=1 Tax=Pseudoneurospora amorphoporcata TaxID=241081 RepID=A0AAN6SEC7_9PEZI|nr:hypothetical protein QBC32DRAFT_347691 [Pseudoneurospora amorphoporcata]